MIIVLNKDGNRYANTVVTSAVPVNCYLPKTSVNLYATQCFYIIDTDSDTDMEITATLVDDEKDLFQFYTHDETTLVASFYDEDELVITDIVDSVKGRIHKVCVAFKHTAATLYSCSLTIVSNDGSVNMDVTLHGESEDVEERYKVALQNMDSVLDERYSKAFKDANVNEDEHDQVLLNRKREEFIAEHGELKGFIGSYYGLINAVKFFGYDDDVFIREYWKGLDESLSETMLRSAKLEDIVDRNLSIQGFEKTNMLSLVYKINDFSGDLDDDGLPELVDVFRNQDEAMIKMRNMRMILEDQFMPAQVWFLDVIGEEIALRNIGRRDFIHDAMINYISYTLAIENHEFTVDANIKERVVQLFDAYDFESTESDGSSTLTDDYYEVLKEFTEDELSELNTFDTVTREKLQRDNVAFITWALDDDYVSILDEIDRVDYILVDSDANEVFRVTKTTTDIIQAFSFVVRPTGDYTFIVRMTDGYAEPHTLYYEFTIVDKVCNFLLGIASDEDEEEEETTSSLYTTFSKFSELYDSIFNADEDETLTNNQEYDPIENRITLANTYLTESTTDGALPVVAYRDTTYDVNNGDNSIFDIDRYYSDVSWGLLNHFRLKDFRGMRLDEMKNAKLSDYSPKYVTVWFDVLLDGETDDRYIELYDIVSKESQRVSAIYKNESSDADYDRVFLAEMAKEINNLKSGVLSDFTAMVLPAQMNEDDGEKLMILLMSKSFDVKSRYRTLATYNESYNTTIREVDFLEDPRAFVHFYVTDLTSGVLNVQVGSSAYSKTVDVTEAADLYNALDEFDNLDAFIDGDGRITVFADDTLKIDHPSIVEVYNVTRKATHRQIDGIRYGADVYIGQVLYAIPDTYMMGRMYNISWSLSLDGEVVKTSTTYAFAFLVNEVGTYELTMTCNDANGTEYTSTRAGVWLCKSGK